MVENHWRKATINTLFTYTMTYAFEYGRKFGIKGLVPFYIIGLLVLYSTVSEVLDVGSLRFVFHKVSSPFDRWTYDILSALLSRRFHVFP